MNIELAKNKDAKEITRIHKQEIASGFLSSLPLKFLEKTYFSVIENDFCVTAKENNEIIGFIAGTANIENLYHYFFRKYFFISLFILAPKVFNFKKIFETIFYVRKKEELPSAELLTIAVKKDFRGQGISKKMLEFFISEMNKRGVKEFKVLVGGNLKPAISFYEKNNFKFLKEIEVHGKEKSRIYIYNL